MKDDDTISEMESIVAEIKKYDVYDIGKNFRLNLMPQNQNKSNIIRCTHCCHFKR